MNTTHQELEPTIAVIEWADAPLDLIAWKFPRYGRPLTEEAELIVREGQHAVILFVDNTARVYEPGRHPMSAEPSAEDAVFHDAVFVSDRHFIEQKWSTPHPVVLHDADFGPVRLRASGSCSLRVYDPGLFIQEMKAHTRDFWPDDIARRLRDILAARFTEALAEDRIPMRKLATNYGEVAEWLLRAAQPVFLAIGVELNKLQVNEISLPPEMEQALLERPQRPTPRI